MRKHPLLENELYAAAIAIKAFDGTVQLIVGVVIFALGPMYVNDHVSGIVTEFAKRELSGDRAIVPKLIGWAAALSPDSTTFAAIYLVAHGVIKLLLVAALWTHKAWGPPTAAAFLVVILAYEMQRIYVHHSMFLSAAAVLDLAIVILIFNEYRIERKARYQRPVEE